MSKNKERKKTLTENNIEVCKQIGCDLLQTNGTCQPFAIASSSSTDLSVRSKRREMQTIRSQIPDDCPRGYQKKYITKRY